MSVLKTQSLPKALTSYDLLKALAILLMVIDHVGYFFYPEEMWFRTLGRLSVPIWFYLIGFAKTREVPRLWWIGAGVVLASAVVSGGYLFPINILFTLILTRILIDHMIVRAFKDTEAFAGMYFICVLLTVPAMLFFEYGFIGMLFAIIGYMRRHAEVIQMKPLPYWGFVIAAAVSYVVMQSVLMPSLTSAQFWTFALGMSGLVFVFHIFDAKTYSGLKGALVSPIQFLGRRSLEIYVLHLLAFRAASMVLNPERFSAFDFALFANENLTRLFL